MKTLAFLLLLMGSTAQASQIISAPSAGIIASFGQLYEDTASPAALTIPSGTASKWENSTVGLTSGTGLVVGSAATDNLTIGTSGVGTYAISFLISCEWGASLDAEFAVYVNGSEQVEIKSARGFAANSPGTTGSAGLLELSSGDVVDLRLYQNSGSNKNVLLYNVSLTIHRVGN